MCLILETARMIIMVVGMFKMIQLTVEMPIVVGKAMVDRHRTSCERRCTVAESVEN